MQKSAAVLGIGTAVPPHRLVQKDAADRLAEALQSNPSAARWARRMFRHCGVDVRYTCEPNLLEPPGQCRYVPGTPASEIPVTSERMATFRREAVPLALEAAEKALADSGIGGEEITHLYTVSCTGLFLPGIDLAIMRRFGLKPDVERIPLTFLGCAAGLTAVRLASGVIARELVKGERNPLALIVCVELCTLHVQPSDRREDLFAAAFFGDGAAACVVGPDGASDGREAHGRFRLGAGRSAVFPDSAEEMAWDLGDFGFQLHLSPRIPQWIAACAPAEIDRLLDGEPLPELWAIHPGGRGIIDAVQQLYRLNEEQVTASRSVLSAYGNLSSATILFVLRKLREEQDAAAVSGSRQRPDESALERKSYATKPSNREKNGLAIAFGPGLHVELLQFAYVPPAV